MTDWKTIRIHADAFDEHNPRRKEMGLSWTEYVDGQAPEYVTERDVLREVVREEAEAAIRAVAQS